MIRAGILNICISIITFLLLYKLSLVIFTTDTARITCLILAFFSPAAIANVLFYRPYQLQTLFFVISIFLFYTITNKINNTTAKIENNAHTIISYSFIISLIILTGYFSLLYIFIFFISLIYFVYKKYKMVKNNSIHKCHNDTFYIYYLSKIFSWTDIISRIRIFI